MMITKINLENQQGVLDKWNMRNEKSFYITRTSMEKEKKLHKKIIFLYIINLTLSNQRPLSCKNNMIVLVLTF